MIRLSRLAVALDTVGAMATTIALITGANKGIGLETARQLGARGITVLAGARDEARGVAAERALRDGGADARFVPLDVTDAKSVRQAADWIDTRVRSPGHPGQQRGYRPWRAAQRDGPG